MRFLLLVAITFASTADAEPWKRHTIDNSSRGADGVRLMDVNGDGLQDITTGWEQGGVIRVYLHPGHQKAKQHWPAVTVGKVKSPEDAVFVDLDNDGRVDVVSCCEGKTKTIFAHWAPKQKSDYLKPDAWITQPIASTQSKQSWMFAVPLEIDGQHGIDLVVGSKGGNATIGWLQAPASPRDMSAWKFHPLYKAGWIMSLEVIDIDQDGDLDVVASDRKGKTTGIIWLENPGKEQSDWQTHRLAGDGLEVMFLDIGDLNGDAVDDIACATRNGKSLVMLRETTSQRPKYAIQHVENASHANGKAAAIGDIDLDGHADLVVTHNTGKKRSHPGVVWFPGKRGDIQSNAHDISGQQGVKFDIAKLVDLDGDGDLDVITCEEVDNLGVFWYENPTR